MDAFTARRLRKTAHASRDEAAQALRALATSLSVAADELQAGLLARSVAKLQNEVDEALDTLDAHFRDEDNLGEVPIDEK